MMVAVCFSAGHKHDITNECDKKLPLVLFANVVDPIPFSRAISKKGWVDDLPKHHSARPQRSQRRRCRRQI